MATANDFMEHVRRINPGAVAVFASSTDAEFRKAVELLFDHTLRRMETARKDLRILKEPGLSKTFRFLLGDLVPSSAEEDSNGHVDVIVRHPLIAGFRYLTECKIWDGHSWHRSGMQQVLGYATSRDTRVMCLAFFVHEKRMIFLLGRLRTDIDADPVLPVVKPSADHGPFPGGFITFHKHQSDATIEIVHAGCDLFEEA